MKGIRKQNADSTYTLRIPLTLCGFRLHLRIPQQLNLTIHMSHCLFLDSTNCFGFRKYGCGFRKFAYICSHFEWNSVLSICVWIPQQQRRSRKSSNDVDSATNLILAYCENRIQCTECTVWPRNAPCLSEVKRIYCIVKKYLPLSCGMFHDIIHDVAQGRIKGGGAGVGRPPLRDSTPCGPKRSPFELFFDIHFWLTDPKIFLKATLAPLYTNF